MPFHIEQREADSMRKHRCLLSLLSIALLAFAPLVTAAVSSTSYSPPATEKSLSTIVAPDPMDAAFRAGVASYETGDYDGAVRAWRVPAEHGHVGAQFTLGVAYATGKGVISDIARAVALWESAAAHGHAAAQFNLGVIYSRGEGVDKDMTKARMWWHLAANRGDAAAQFHLGVLAVTGEGGPRNLEEAAHWWRQSAAQGFEQAAKGLQILREHGALLDDTHSSNYQ